MILIKSSRSLHMFRLTAPLYEHSREGCIVSKAWSFSVRTGDETQCKLVLVNPCVGARMWQHGKVAPSIFCQSDPREKPCGCNTRLHQSYRRLMMSNVYILVSEGTDFQHESSDDCLSSCVGSRES